MSAAAKRLLIVKTSSIGDVVHALPVAQIVKEHCRGIEIGWVVRRKCAELVTGNPYIDRVYEMENRPSAASLATLGRELRQERYDTAWDMQGLFLSGLVTRLSGARRRIGLDLNREFNRLFLSAPVVPARAERRRHAITILRGFLPSLGIPIDVDWPKLCYLAEGSTMPEQFANLADVSRSTAIALNVGASSIYKQWPVRHWAGLADGIANSGRIPVLLGGPQDAATAEEIFYAIGNEEQLKTANLVGQTTLRQIAGVLNSCAALITGDTGPMHIGAALGVPTVALFGPTDPVKTGSYGTASIPLKYDVCCTTNHRRPTCNGDVRCMQAISVEEAYTALMRVLEQTSLRC